MRAPSHVVQDQSEAIAFLVDPLSHGGKTVERADTHGAVVVLAGDRAYKLKRAVRFPYMDFSSIALRKRACEAEVALNRRTAPDVYLGVEPLIRTASGTLAIGGAGEAVDWLVVMRRFDESQLLDRLALRGKLDAEIMTALTDAILRFHDSAERRVDHGGAAVMAQVIADNDRGFREAGAEFFSLEKVSALRERSTAILDRLGGLLDERRARGLVRHCHGDLHLRNICLIEGKPTLFDAIEFNERFACIDVLYDLAFLLMDLDHRGLGDLANLVLNRYLSEGVRFGGLGDLSGLATLPLFLAARAAVRAVVGVAMAAAQRDFRTTQELLAEVQSYLDLAIRYITSREPCLVAIGGLSGTGKSTLARRVASDIGPAPGAVVLRSDVIRKELARVGTLERLGDDAYSAAMNARVYATIAGRAREVLLAGHGVIADAVHARSEERDAIEAVARGCGVRFLGFWLDAPPEMLVSRITRRHHDASDATVEVLRRQLHYSLGPITWEKIDVTGTEDTTLTRIRRRLAPGISGR